MPQFWSYDVFLSYVGSGTSVEFVNNLEQSLRQERLSLFGDLSWEGDATSARFKAIHESRIAIIVFSENYASHVSCLEELVEILQDFEIEGRLIYPVYYYVDRKDVGDQTKNCETFKDERPPELQNWCMVLSQAADLPDYQAISRTTPVHECIEKIVERVIALMNEKKLEEEEEHDKEKEDEEEEEHDDNEKEEEEQEEQDDNQKEPLTSVVR